LSARASGVDRDCKSVSVVHVRIIVGTR
jgi:hypothetical protein